MKNKQHNALPVIMAACDEVYFRRHALGFCKSAISSGHDVLIVVSPIPGPNVQTRAKALADRLFPRFRKKFNDEELRNLKLICVHDERANRKLEGRAATIYFQSLRFYCLPDLLREYDRPLLMLDIDSIIRTQVRVDTDADLGLFLRLNNQKGRDEYDRLGMKVAAGLVYAAPQSLAFFQRVADYLDQHDMRYFADQRALFETYKVETSLRIVDLAPLDLLDWHFSQTSAIWTGKGKRRRRDPQFIRERLRYEGWGKLGATFRLLAYQLRFFKA